MRRNVAPWPVHIPIDDLWSLGMRTVRDYIMIFVDRADWGVKLFNGRRRGLAPPATVGSRCPTSPILQDVENDSFIFPWRSRFIGQYCVLERLIETAERV